MNPSKQDEAEDHAAALINVAAWFARWIVADRLGIYGLGTKMEIDQLPDPFRKLVAMHMVIDRSLGYTDTEKALHGLVELYGWGPE